MRALMLMLQALLARGGQALGSATRRMALELRRLERLDDVLVEAGLLAPLDVVLHTEAAHGDRS